MAPDTPYSKATKLHVIVSFFLTTHLYLKETRWVISSDFKLVGVGPRLKLRKNHLPQCNTITKSTAESFKHQVCASYHST